MTALLLSLVLCWTPNTEADLLGYWVQSAERHVTDWVVCACAPGVPCPQHIFCPVYNGFQWQWTFTGIVPGFTRTDCANEPNSLCVFRHPIAEDWSGNVSAQQPIGNDVWTGGCS